MDWKVFFSVLVPGLIVIVGWFVAHWLTVRREFAARRREATLKALEAAYMRLSTASNRAQTEELMQGIETFVSEIQLYGSLKQIGLMGKIVERLKVGTTVSFDEILADLRNSLRKELALTPVAGPVWWFRFHRPTAIAQATARTSPVPIGSKPPYTPSAQPPTGSPAI